MNFEADEDSRFRELVTQVLQKGGLNNKDRQQIENVLNNLKTDQQQRQYTKGWKLFTSLLLREEQQELKQHVLKAVNDQGKRVSPKKKKNKRKHRTTFFGNDLIGLNLSKMQTAANNHNYSSNGNSPRRSLGSPSMMPQVDDLGQSIDISIPRQKKSSFLDRMAKPKKDPKVVYIDKIA